MKFHQNLLDMCIFSHNPRLRYQILDNPGIAGWLVSKLTTYTYTAHTYKEHQMGIVTPNTYVYKYTIIICTKPMGLDLNESRDLRYNTTTGGNTIIRTSTILKWETSVLM